MTSALLLGSKITKQSVYKSRGTSYLHFQPLTVYFKNTEGRMQPYHHDLLLTFQSGHRRLVFVRFETSLEHPETTRDIQAIIAATPKSAADDLIVVNASDYTRQRRENLLRMYSHMTKPDQEADDIVWESARRLRSFYYMNDLFPHVPIPQPRAFAACYRLVAKGLFRANLDHVLWEHSHIGVVA